MDPKKLKELTADADRWDTGELGSSAEHSRAVSDELQREIDQSIDEGLGLQLISIRLNKAVVEELKILAKEDGIGYQPLIRQILARYVKENKKSATTNAAPTRAVAKNNVPLKSAAVNAKSKRQSK